MSEPQPTIPRRRRQVPKCRNCAARLLKRESVVFRLCPACQQIGKAGALAGGIVVGAIVTLIDLVIARL